jgi:uncharacterized repeat protein (TIGR03803 family)
MGSKGDAMKKARLEKIVCITAVLWVAAAAALQAQTVNAIFTFDGTNGTGIYEGSSLTQGIDGNFYGASITGGADYGSGNQGYGTIFKLTPEGVLTTLYNFCSKPNCADGYAPNGTLVQDADGNLYGTTQYGGKGSRAGCDGLCGTVFKITAQGKFTTLYSFCEDGNETECADGIQPFAGLVQGVDGDFYGTTINGGTACGACGTIFKITPSGVFTTLVSFDNKDGAQATAALTLAANGRFYGSTSEGGAGSDPSGTFFEMTEGGELSTSYSYPCCGLDGMFQDPSTLVQASNGDFYGTTKFGNNPNVWLGTVFELTPGGKLKVLHAFCLQGGDCSDGAYPKAGLVQGSDGNLYGVAAGGGAEDGGVIFQVTAAGEYKHLSDFCSKPDCPNGENPYTALTQGTDGLFYGTAQASGTTACGCATVYTLSMGLGPFVKTLFNFGRVGSTVTVLGNNLTGTTSVTFNGVAATFTAGSDTYIQATVPTGATTGTIEVTTPTGTLSSNVAFQVLL